MNFCFIGHIRDFLPWGAWWAGYFIWEKPAYFAFLQEATVSHGERFCSIGKYEKTGMFGRLFESLGTLTNVGAVSIMNCFFVD